MTFVPGPLLYDLSLTLDDLLQANGPYLPLMYWRFSNLYPQPRSLFPAPQSCDPVACKRALLEYPICPSNSTSVQFSSVQFSRSVMYDSATPWTTACQASLSITNSRSLLKLMSIESVMPSSHLILCHPLLLLPSIPPSIRVFSNESALCMRWPKYWSFSFSISPSNEHPGLISFRMDWLDLKFNIFLIKFIILVEDSNCTPAVTISETGTTTHIASQARNLSTILHSPLFLPLLSI